MLSASCSRRPLAMPMTVSVRRGVYWFSVGMAGRGRNVLKLTMRGGKAVVDHLHSERPVLGEQG